MRRIGSVTVRTLKKRKEWKTNVEQEDIAKAYIALLKTCAQQKDLRKGASIHADIRKLEFLENNYFVGNTLISMYAKCGALEQAKEVFENLPCKDVVSWSALIAGYAQQGNAQEALDCYEQMQAEHVSVNAITCMSILKACGTIGALDKGEKIYDEIIRQGFLGENALLGGALVGMYCKCGALSKAQALLEGLSSCCEDSWSALISSYAQSGLIVEAFGCLHKMQEDGLSPTFANFACILKACGHVRANDKGKYIHTEIVKRGLLENNNILGGTLVDMYVKCGALPEAALVLAKLPARDVVSWSAVVAGYVQYEQAKEALNFFEMMQSDGLSPNAITFACILKACASLGALDKGKQIHGEILRQGWLCKDVVLGGALIDMYAKCGALAKAQEVIKEIPVRNVVSWTALVAGYAQLGQVEEALFCFKRMQCDGVSPNEVTFVCLLSACSHTGLSNMGQTCFDMMSAAYGIFPDLEHRTCMVDLFSRMGLFDEAVAMIEKMQCPSYLPVWSTLLGACQKWGNVQLASLAFDHALKMDRKDASAYASMCSLYDAVSVTKEAIQAKRSRVNG